MTRRIAVEPKSGRFESLEAAVVAGGGVVSDLAQAEALIWADPSVPDRLPQALAGAVDLRWVALPFAGIEPYVDMLDQDRIWTCARGVYARPVAEHVLALALGGMRNVIGYARQREWTGPQGRNLLGANVTIFGGGGIAEELVALLKPFDCRVTVVRRREEPFPGADRTLGMGERLTALADADLVVLALALTPETVGLIDADALAAMGPDAWLVNVARGGHVDHDALLQAVLAGEIGGACLDVTEPEPLPADHGLWKADRVVVTPHVGNTPEMGVPLLAAHIQENVRRFVRGDVLEGVIDIDAGY